MNIEKQFFNFGLWLVSVSVLLAILTGAKADTDENPITQNPKYDWGNFARDLARAEGRLQEEEVIDAVVEDAPPALPSGEDGNP